MKNRQQFDILPQSGLGPARENYRTSIAPTAGGPHSEIEIKVPRKTKSPARGRAFQKQMAWI
jgi:hypothetical protein